MQAEKKFPTKGGIRLRGSSMGIGLSWVGYRRPLLDTGRLFTLLLFALVWLPSSMSKVTDETTKTINRHSERRTDGHNL